VKNLTTFANPPVVSVACKTRVLNGTALGIRTCKNGNTVMIVRESDGKIRSAIVK